MRRPSLITLLICAYCVLCSLDLVETWLSSSSIPVGAGAFVLWLSPVAVFWCSRMEGSPPEVPDRPILLGLALFFSFIGGVGSLRVLSHAGLALAVGSLMPASGAHLLWLSSSPAWMPALDWLGGRFFVEYTTVARILLASLTSLYLVRTIQHVSRGSS